MYSTTKEIEFYRGEGTLFYADAEETLRCLALLARVVTMERAFDPSHCVDYGGDEADLHRLSAHMCQTVGELGEELFF